MNTPQDDPFSTARNREWLAEFREEPGPVRNAFPMPAAALDALRDRVPPTLSDLWQTDGLGTLYKEQVWMCDPTDFAPLVHVLFSGDPDLHPQRTHVYAYSVFGTLVIWNEDHNDGEVDLTRGLVTCRGLTADRPRGNVNLDVLSALETWMMDSHGADEQDDSGNWLFARLRKSLGPTAYGECYGLTPIRALGGAATLENYRKVPALEHFLLLAQSQEFTLRDTLSRPIRDVRTIGG